MEAAPASHGRFWLAGRFTPREVDWIVTAAAAGLALAAAIHGFNTAPQIGPRNRGPLALGAVPFAAVPFASLPLLWRRIRPGTVLTIVALAFVPYTVVRNGAPGGAGLVFAVYAAALYGNRFVRVAAGALALAVLAFAVALLGATDSVRWLGHGSADAFGCGVAWVLGDRTRTRRAYLRELEDRARRLERERDEHAERAAADERNRIARELHDVVAHSVSVIAVQAGAGRSTTRSHPERSIEVLEVIERTARTALGELRSLVGVLRRDGDDTSLRRPQPTLGEIDALVALARNTGLRVNSTVMGEPRPLDALVDLSAYRIVQEALTNVMKHAPGSAVEVLVGYGPDRISVTVRNDWPPRAGVNGSTPEPGLSPAGIEPGRSLPGHGLIGMRERAAMAGGTLEAGPDPAGDGWRVHADLPAPVMPVAPGMPGATSTRAGARSRGTP